MLKPPERPFGIASTFQVDPTAMTLPFQLAPLVVLQSMRTWMAGG
jgi:hypothetical protein